MATEAPPTDDASIEKVLRDRRFGPPQDADVTPWDFVLRWPDRVVRGQVWPIVSRLLVDSDPTVRARATEFTRRWSDGAELVKPRLLEVAEQHLDLYGDQTSEGITLRGSLSFALTSQLDDHNRDRIAAVLKQMVQHEPLGQGVAAVIGRYEPMLVAELAQKWGDTQADWIARAAGSAAMYKRDSVIPLLGALRGLSKETREQVLAAVEEYISRDDARAGQIAAARGFGPPNKVAPSAEYCRHAVGL